MLSVMKLFTQRMSTEGPDDENSSVRGGVRVGRGAVFSVVSGRNRLKFYDENPDFIAPPSRRNEVISFVKVGCTIYRYHAQASVGATYPMMKNI